MERKNIEEIKFDSSKFQDFVNKNNNGGLVRFLDRLGKLPSNFDKKPLIKLLKNENDKVRALVIKNLAKLSDISLLELYTRILKSESSSTVRREAVSAIGRLRNEVAINSLINLLNDKDPEVILQAIRGLFVFKDKENVKKQLSRLENHPNEIVQEVIKKEFKEKSLNKNLIKHSESLDCMKNTIVFGDVRESIRSVPSDSVHLTFTSPPYYNARDYSIYRSYNEYLNFLEEVFREVHRITKEGRFFVLNTSPIIIPRVSRQHSSKRYPIPYDIHYTLTKIGWEFVDDIIWVKPEASVKNRIGGFLQHRKPLGYKPNARTENIMVYRKKTDKLIDWNIKQYNHQIIERSKVNGSYETSNVWQIDPTFDKTHSAVFPIELCDRVIKYYSFIGDLVFDPFAGSGTVGKSAMNLNRNFFLTEVNKKYIDRIKENLGLNVYYNNKKPTFLNTREFNVVIKNELNTTKRSD
jgi:DNA modification methylase